MDATNITIKSLHTFDEFFEAVDLQKIYWGTEGESLLPAHMMFSIVHTGGHVIAAMDSDRMVGVLIGLIGTDIQEADRPAMANLLIASKRMVVLPEYRSAGIGYRLKLMQRDLAVQQGIRLVTWTFDPLLSKNAYLNMHKLGGICQKYLENYYGTDERTGLVTLGSSDRLPVEWWVTNRRVEMKLHGDRSNLTLEQYLDGNATIINPTKMSNNTLYPPDTMFEPMSAFGLLEIPIDYPEIIATDPDLAMGWREHTRAAFQYLFQKGYIVTDFIRGRHEGQDRVFYVVSYNSGVDFNLN